MAVFAVFQGMQYLTRESASGLPHWRNFENNMVCVWYCSEALMGIQTPKTLLKIDLPNGFSDVTPTANGKNKLQNSSQSPNNSF